MQCDKCGADMRCAGIDRDGSAVVQKFICVNPQCPDGAENLKKYKTKREEKEHGQH